MARVNSKKSIEFFIDELQARKPSPGGGAVAALAGALGIGLIIKVSNYTLGKSKYERYGKEIKTIVSKANRLKNKLCALIEKDALAYEEYSKTKTTVALKKAALCVAEISEFSKEALKVYKRVRVIGNVNLKGDLDAAGILLNSSIKVADNLVKLNRRRTGR